MPGPREIAREYVTLVRAQRYMELLDRLYAQDAVSVEAAARPGGSRSTQGLEALRQKCRDFDATFRVDEQVISEPMMHGEDRFAVHMSFKMTHRESGQARVLDEVAVLTLDGEKIAHEAFFYET